MTPDGNLNFTPKPIDAVGLRLGEGTNVKIAVGIIQRTAALRAYANFKSGRDWMEKLSTAYVVALATRSADELLMRLVQDELAPSCLTKCRACREASIGVSRIRERLFPTLKSLREHANALIHHLDHPLNKGVSELNIEGVFGYCHHLFQENSDALLGDIRYRMDEFPSVQCKKCSAKRIPK